jgi:ankyrin repeat protein
MAILPPVNSAPVTSTPPVVLSLHEMIEGNRSVEEIASAITPLNINLKRNGKTPFILAIQRDDMQLTRLLLERGADPAILADKEEEDVDSTEPALISAARRGDFFAVKKLIESGANVRETNLKKYTPLHAASEAGHVAIMRLLLSRDASWQYIDQQTTEGCTALYLAAQKGYRLAVEEILSRGACDLTDQKGFRAYDIARIGFHHYIANLIEAVKTYGYPLPSNVCVTENDYDFVREINRCLD